MAHTQADQTKQDAKAGEDKERSDKLQKDQEAAQRKEAELKSLDDSEVQRAFVSKGHGERLTMIVRYHPPTRDSGGIKAGELRPAVKELGAKLQELANKALEEAEPHPAE
jgi:hypothetical protein